MQDLVSNKYKIAWSGMQRQEDVIVDYSPGNHDAKYSQSDIDLIEKEWSDRNKTAALEGRTIYNSEIFRLSSHSVTKNGRLALNLGKTSYREYVATRSPERAISRANPIGTCILPITSDGLIPIGRRSQTAEVNPGKFFTFGGFFDAALDMDGLKPEIFDCIRREVREELDISLDTSGLYLIGIVLDLINIHPEFSFVAETNLSSSEIMSSDWKSELDDLTFVPEADCLEFLNRNRSDFTPTLIGAFEIFAERMKSEQAQWA